MERLSKEEVQKRKDIVLKNIRWETYNPNNKGGQQVGIMPKKITLISDDLDITICVGYEKSLYKNRDIALLLFDLALEDILSK